MIGLLNPESSDVHSCVGTFFMVHFRTRDRPHGPFERAGNTTIEPTKLVVPL